MKRNELEKIMLEKTDEFSKLLKMYADILVEDEEATWLPNENWTGCIIRKEKIDNGAQMPPQSFQNTFCVWPRFGSAHL